jgi:hypothetical protein
VHEWMGQSHLTRKWEAIVLCTDPEVSNNDLIDLNNQCTNAGIPYSTFHVATKFAHLLQTAHDVAYLPILSDLAREGPSANIVNLWHVAQMTYNQLKENAARTAQLPKHLGLAAQTQGKGHKKQTKGQTRSLPPCDWCTALGHSD